MSLLGPRLGGGLASEASFSEEIETDDEDENKGLCGQVLHSGKIPKRSIVGKPPTGVSEITSASWSSLMPDPVNVKAMRASSSDVIVKKGRSGMRSAANWMSR